MSDRSLDAQIHDLARENRELRTKVQRQRRRHAAGRAALVQEIATLRAALDEAQQWIDSEPDWKAKYNANYLTLYKRAERIELALRTLMNLVDLIDGHEYPSGMTAALISAGTALIHLSRAEEDSMTIEIPLHIKTARGPGRMRVTFQTDDIRAHDAIIHTTQASEVYPTLHRAATQLAMLLGAEIGVAPHTERELRSGLTADGHQVTPTCPSSKE